MRERSFFIRNVCDASFSGKETLKKQIMKERSLSTHVTFAGCLQKRQFEIDITSIYERKKPFKRQENKIENW